jgi:D-glycero-alpha-D-manno-heptose-7-phosphate kinase
MIPRSITASAPVRIADNGGWTDTWFALHGSVVNIAVRPGVEVTLQTRARVRGEAAVLLTLEGTGIPHPFEPGSGHSCGHPLLEAAIEYMGIPDGLHADVHISSIIPPGASTGTSAAVTVALLAALARLHARPMTRHDLAMLAHHVEMDLLGWQCGVQDQFAAAYGGINHIAISGFPEASVETLVVPEAARRELEQRLLLVYLGTAHQSSEVHRMVIAELEQEGAGAPRLEELRHCAARAREALLAGDLERFGQALIANTEAQARLHPSLVGSVARRLLDIASAHAASGWKVNGAGGDGGSLTLLCGPAEDDRRALVTALEAEPGAHRIIPLRLCEEGVTVAER